MTSAIDRRRTPRGHEESRPQSTTRKIAPEKVWVRAEAKSRAKVEAKDEEKQARAERRRMPAPTGHEHRDARIAGTASRDRMAAGTATAVATALRAGAIQKMRHAAAARSAATGGVNQGGALRGNARTPEAAEGRPEAGNARRERDAAEVARRNPHEAGTRPGRIAHGQTPGCRRPTGTPALGETGRQRRATARALNPAQKITNGRPPGQRRAVVANVI